MGRKGAAVKMKMPTAAIIISYRFMAVALPYHSQSVRVAARCESPPCQPALRVFLRLAANILTSTAHPLKLNFYNFRESVMMSAMAGGD